MLINGNKVSVLKKWNTMVRWNLGRACLGGSHFKVLTHHFCVGIQTQYCQT